MVSPKFEYSKDIFSIPDLFYIKDKIEAYKSFRPYSFIFAKTLVTALEVHLPSPGAKSTMRTTPPRRV